MYLGHNMRPYMTYLPSSATKPLAKKPDQPRLKISSAVWSLSLETTECSCFLSDSSVWFLHHLFTDLI